ncbi:MAG: histidine phosphatase family protein [Clostridium sp.]
MKLYLIRHGQTQWNIEGKIQGKTDIPLNQVGIDQAKLLSEAMEEHSVSAIFSSPLKRAYETACIVASSKNLPVIPVRELEEVDFGLWEGMTWNLINEKYPADFAAWDKNPTTSTPTGGETRESCRTRCEQAMNSILSTAGGDIAIVAHGGILVFVVDFLLRTGQDKNEMIVRNASITTIEYHRDTGIGTLLVLNDTHHLKRDLKSDAPESSSRNINKYC